MTGSIKFVIVLISLAVLVLGQQQQADVETVFNTENADSYIRGFTIDIPAKREDCFFIELKEGQVLNFHFMVSKLTRRKGWSFLRS